MSNNYGEILCQATEILAKHLIDQVAYDRTILCTIVKDDEKELGKYRVQNSEAIFDAYTSDTTLRKNDQVYVSVPMGDWNEQKLIIAKKMDNINQPIAYKDPFNSFINITGNLIGSNIKSQGLIANDTVKKQVLIWSYNKDDDALVKNSGDVFNGYTHLAISADFQAWLKELGIVTGDYGLNLVIEVDPEDASDIIADGDTISSNIKVCSLNCSDMIGNPYNFESFYNQKKLFNISNIKNIKSMELWFYQKEGSFLNQNQEVVPPQTTPNIFVKDIAISFGYGTEGFENDALIIYTMDTIKYDVKKTPAEDNHKQLFARWIHKFEDGNIKVVDLDDGLNYTLTWYRYEQGARSHTAWSGVDWNPLATQEVEDDKVIFTIIDPDWKEYNDLSLRVNDTPTRNMSFDQAWLLPDITRAEEKIKAIVSYKDQIFESPLLVFSNVDEVVNKATVDAIQALSINCEDESFGNYLIYNLGGQIVDSADAQKVRRFKAYFNSAADDVDDNLMAELVEAESIEWIIPANNTMIDVSNFISRIEDTTPIDGYYHIFRFADETGNIRANNDQRYKIKSYYTHNYSNNTIKCIVTKNKIKYTTTKELTFGPAGTSGTDYSFILDFSEGITALTLESDYATGETIPKVMVQARLYDYTGQEIPNLEIRDIQWSLDESKLDNANTNDNVLSNDYIEIIPQTEKNKVEIKLKDSVTSVPINNYTVLKAVLKASSGVGDDGWGDYDLYAYLPIPIRSSRDYQFISGTTTIAYNALGYLDNFFQNPYRLYYMNQDTVDATLETINGTWDVYSAIANDPYLPKKHQNREGQWYITPISIYVEDSMQNLCTVGTVNGTRVWSQPLFVTQNKYPSSIINRWNGELTIDNANNAILAAKMVAGKKHDDNTFSGVMMGDWSGDEVVYETITDPKDPTKTITQPRKDKTGATVTEIAEHTGIYGFQKGIASFGFRDDGTAFIGKPGAGRLEFNGDSSRITSNRMENNLGGMMLDFDDGLIEMVNPDNATLSGTIKLDATAKTTPFTIGENFKVNWDGSIEAHNGKFYGHLEGSSGHIGGWTLDEAGNLYSDNRATILYRNGQIVADYIETYSGDIGGWQINPWGLSSADGEFYLASYGMLSMGNGTYPTVIDSSGVYVQKITIYDSIKVGGGGTNADGSVNRPTTTVGGIQGYLGTVASGLTVDPDGTLDSAAGVGLISKGEITTVKVLDTHVGMAYKRGGYTSIGSTASSIYGKNYLNLRSNTTSGQVSINANKLVCTVPKANQTGIYARFA